MNLDKFNKMFRLLDSSTGQISQHFFDDFVEENATRFHEMGLKSVLIRRQIGECCDYCKKLVGVYDYDDLPDGIYSRHRDCKCLLTFKTEKGGYVDVWSKKQFNTQRDARIQRINEIEEQQAMTLAGKQGRNLEETLGILNQDEINPTPPPGYEHYFEGFEELTLSDDNISMLNTLQNLSKETGYEYAAICTENGEIIGPFTSNEVSSVSGFDSRLKDTGNILLHSHTNNTLLSVTDIRWLADERVAEVAVKTPNNNICAILRNYGETPTIQEFDERVLSPDFAKQIDRQTMEGYSDFIDWNNAERQYMFFFERTYSIAREFGWSIEGGVING